MTNLIDIETFQATLPACEDYLLHSYINVCQNELKIRSERELELAKNALAKCSKDQLLSVLLHLGIDLPPEPAEKKSRERKTPVPYGYKSFGEYFVPKYFNAITRESVVGSQAVFLQGLGRDEKLQRFGTVQQLQAGTLALAELVELGLVYTMQDNTCIPCTLDMLPTAAETATVPDKPAKKSKQRQPEVEVAA